MVYLSGVTDHKVATGDMVDHIVELVEAKAAELEALNESGDMTETYAAKRIA